MHPPFDNGEGYIKALEQDLTLFSGQNHLRTRKICVPILGLVKSSSSLNWSHQSCVSVETAVDDQMPTTIFNVHDFTAINMTPTDMTRIVKKYRNICRTLGLSLTPWAQITNTQYLQAFTSYMENKVSTTTLTCFTLCDYKY